MAALNVSIADPGGSFASKYGDLTAALNQAFGAWMSHFDAPQGIVNINVAIGLLATAVPLGLGTVADSGPKGAVQIGRIAAGTVFMSGFAAEVATGAPLSDTNRTSTLNLDYIWFNNKFANPAANSAEIQRVLQHEIGRMLGFFAYSGTPGGQAVPASSTLSTLDAYLQFGGGVELFVGPNAVAQNGGPVLMDYNTVFQTAVSGASIMSAQQRAATIQPLDVAILRDTGLPILSDAEVQEHAATRLYQAAFGRAPDTAGLMQQSRALLAGTSLSTLANGFIGSAEFASRYGVNPSTGDFVSAMYQNVLHRSADAAGLQVWTTAIAGGLSRADVLTGFSDSAENRNALSVNPNLSYSATAEAQTRRMYDTAFGRTADPLGFTLYANALLNGTTLQQAALGFIGSQEFANRYGAAPSNEVLVDALYKNTLHRAPDAAGRAVFTDALNRGVSRADVVVGFSESAEHVRNVIAQDTALSSSSALLLADPLARLGTIPVLPGRLFG